MSFLFLSSLYYQHSSYFILSPLSFSPFNFCFPLTPPPSIEVKCPLCSREIVSSELEIHLVACVTKPRVMYNGKMLAGSQSYSGLQS